LKGWPVSDGRFKDRLLKITPTVGKTRTPIQHRTTSNQQTSNQEQAPGNQQPFLVAIYDVRSTTYDGMENFLKQDWTMTNNTAQLVKHVLQFNTEPPATSKPANQQPGTGIREQTSFNLNLFDFNILLRYL